MARAPSLIMATTLAARFASAPSVFDLLDEPDALPVDSTLIRSVRYDERAQTLEIAFESGAVYHYLHVPEPVKDGLLSADSKGGYFNSRIRGAFTFRRVR